MSATIDRSTARKTALLGIGAACVIVATGAAAAASPTLAIMAVGLCLLPLMLRGGTWVWALAATLVVLFARPFVASQIAPASLIFADFPLALGALILALLRNRQWRLGRRLAPGLVATGLAVLLSALFAAGSALAGLLSFLVFVEPWLIVAAIMIDPPEDSIRRRLVATLVVGALLQLPIAIIQAVTYGLSDPVQGTFVGNGAAAHVLGAFAVLAAIISLTRFLQQGSPWWLMTALGLFTIPVLSDAKQVLFALPIAIASLLPSVRRGIVGKRWLATMALLGFAALPVAAMSATQVAVTFIRHAGFESGKTATIGLIRERMESRPFAMIIGLGPGQTVSRVALLSSDGLVNPDSPIAFLQLPTSELTRQVIVSVPTENSSFEAGGSSVVGLWGDFGLLGAAAYSLLLIGVWISLSNSVDPLVPAARAGLMLMLTLGLVANWWEQPPFTVPLAILLGVAASRSKHTSDDNAG